LKKPEAAGALKYSAAITGTLPAQLTLNIPGGEFPAWPAVRLPTVETFVLISPTNNELVTTDTKIKWVAGKAADTQIFLSMYYNEFGTENLLADCWAKDDGEFVLPSDIQTLLRSANSDIFLVVERRTRDGERRESGDSILNNSLRLFGLKLNDNLHGCKLSLAEDY